MRLAFLIPLMMLLAACGSEEKKSGEGTEVSINAGDEHGGAQGEGGINVEGRADKATVKLGFTSPAAPTKAADWMASEFAKKGVKVTRSGDTLAGKDKDGADFRINFAPDGATAKGEVVIVKS